jgi:hypothetical protein
MILGWLKLVNPKVWIVLAIVAATALGLGYTYRKGGDAPRAEIAAMKQAQAVEAARQLKNKERADEEAKSRSAAVGRELDRLRGLAGLTPGVPVGTKRPDLIAFDRAEFDRALRDYEGEVQEVLGVCAAAVVDLDVARDWAKGL